MAKYTVAEFADGIYSVSSTWLKTVDDELVCLWPPYRELSTVTLAAKKQDIPADGWQAYPVKALLTTGE